MIAAVTLALVFAAGASPSEDEAPVRVFVLAGQSNMEGKGFPEPVVAQLGDPTFRDRWTKFVEGGDVDAFLSRHAKSIEANPRQPDYAWSTRDDVFVKFLGQHGPLTVGFAAPAKCFGPEYEFGHALGDYYDEPVLLIKTAWGGKSLGCDFLPPSATQPTDEELAAETDETNQRITQRNERDRKRAEEEGRGDSFKPKPLATVEQTRARYGHYYRAMLDEVRTTQEHLDTLFPALAGRELSFEGFVWFQGWNDQFNEGFSGGYDARLEHLLRDVRRDLKAPHLRAVVGVVGFDGPRDVPQKNGVDTPRTLIKRAQATVSTRPEFTSWVASVETAPYWDMEADAIYHGPGGWQADVAAWQRFGNDRPYHYLGSPWFFARAGRAFGEQMVILLQARDGPR